MPSASELVAKGYYGYADWGDAEANADFAKTQGAGKGGPTSGGSGVSIPNISRPAVPDFQGIYDTAVKAGTEAPQAELDKLTGQLVESAKAKNEAVAKIADNPYLSEATMTGRIGKLENKYNADTQVLTGQQANVQNKISVAKADAQVKLNIAQNQYNIQDQQYQQQVQQINQYLSSGLLNNASEGDIAQIATTTGMSPSMVQSIIQASKASKEVKPQLMTVDDGINQKIVAVDSNGKVVNTQVIGASQAKASTSTAASDKQAKADADMQARFEKAIADGIKQLQSGSQWGEVWQRIKTLFPDAPPELIDQLLGTSWRQPGAYQAYLANKKGY